MVVVGEKGSVSFDLLARFCLGRLGKINLTSLVEIDKELQNAVRRQDAKKQNTAQSSPVQV